MEVKNPFEETRVFIAGLDSRTQHKIVHTLELLETFGHEIGQPHSKHIESGLLELRIRGTIPVRFLYCFHKGSAYILHGFIKKRWRILESDLDTARTRLRLLRQT